MHRRSAQVWFQFPGYITAVNREEAVYVQAFCHAVNGTRLYLYYMEVLDIQRYRVVRKPEAMLRLLTLPSRDQYFIFPFYLN